jgi:hypothetical protein
MTKDDTQPRALRGATGVKNGVKSGDFWRRLSQDVALNCSGSLTNLYFVSVQNPYYVGLKMRAKHITCSLQKALLVTAYCTLSLEI